MSNSCGAESIDIPNFRCALALNNISVKLLSSNCFLQGIDTLKDATALIKATFHPNLETAKTDADQAFQHAHERLASPQVVNLQSASIQIRSLQLFDNNQNQRNTLNAVLSDNTSSTAITTIWFDQDYLSGSTKSPEFASAIILFNMAIAYICMSKVTSTTTTSERSCRKKDRKFHNGAIRLLQISRSILMRLLAGSGGERSFPLLQILNATTVIVHTLVRAGKEGARDEATGNHFRLLLRQLRHKVAVMEKELLVGFARTAAAA